MTENSPREHRRDGEEEPSHHMRYDNGRDLEITGLGGTKFRARGYDILTLVVVAGLSVMSYVLWRHMEDAVSFRNEATQAAAATVETLKALAREQRFTTCILATKEDQREAQYGSPNSFCNRMAK